MSKRASRRPRSCSTKPSSARTRATSRSSRARRWRTGRTASCTCTARRRAPCRPSPSIARWVGIEPTDVVLISEYTGGGFGSKIPGAIAMAIPALLSKKANAPVMMRITREDEHYIGRARPALHSRVKVGFAKDGRITALDLLRRRATTARTTRRATARSAGDHRLARRISRWRCGGAASTVLTNTPPRGAQRAPGGMQGNVAHGADPREGGAQARHRPGRDPQDQRAGRQGAVRSARMRGAARHTSTSAFVKEALDKGAELFNWEEKKARSGKRIGTKVRGVGVAVSAYSAGSIGFDGLLIIKPDGQLQFQSGIGNLGTRLGDRRASRRRRDPGRAVGAVRRRLGQHGASTCRGPARRAAARRRMR